MQCVKCSHTIVWWIENLEDMDNPTYPYKVTCECDGLMEPIHKINNNNNNKINQAMWDENITD